MRSDQHWKMKINGLGKGEISYEKDQEKQNQEEQKEANLLQWMKEFVLRKKILILSR